jgi:RNA polymerase sigma-70 factor (ECF subfamily)
MDDDAFDAWVLATWPESFRLARRLLGNEDDAADVAQESYIRALMALRAGRFRSGQDALASWLRTIVVRCSLDLLRMHKRRREHTLTDLDEPHVPPTPESGMDRRTIERALRQLPDDQRVAFVLREVEGLTLKETASLLDCTVGAVEQRVLRAWAGLKKRIPHDPS